MPKQGQMWLPGLGMLGALLLGAGSAFGAGAVKEGPAGAAFYTPPQPLDTAEHGTVIWSRPLETSAALPSAGRNLLLLYHSRTVDGQDIAVSGALAIPKGTPPEGGWPLITWTHGTTGLDAACSPSRDTATGPQHEFLEIQQQLLDGYVKRGYAVAATDYQGLGGPGLHPFLQGAAEAHGALDIIRAARAIDADIGTRFVAMGHSQGGHADLFTSALAPEYTPELELLSNVAFAPASHITETLESMVTGAQPSLRLAYSMYVLQSFASNHPDIDLTAILSAQALEHLPETLDACITATSSSGYWATAIPKDQFVPNVDLSTVLKVAKANEPDRLNINVPTLVAQGMADDTVMPNWTDAVVRKLCSNGTFLHYAVFPGANHEQVVGRAADLAQDWIDASFSKGKLETNCKTLPFAGAQ